MHSATRAKRILIGSVFGLAALAAARAANFPAPIGPLPSPAQLAWQEDETTLFVHFNMDTFTGRMLGLGTEDPNLFDPTDLDCAQWVKAAKDNGFTGIILTAKHHDGFCLWPTRTTKHSVASSSWRGGHGDVVRELADACHAAGIKLGIYCSPWDRSQPIYETDPEAYSRLYRQQLTELLSNYGPIFEMWFDGNHAKIADWPAVIALVRRLQPNAVIKQGPRVLPIREDVRWVGNEQAMAPLTAWSVYPAPGAAAPSAAQPPIWFPVECDTMLIGHWFWDGTPARPLPTLLNYYYTSVGRNSMLILNVAPDRRGLFSDASIQRLHEFHQAINTIFGYDLAAGCPASASNVRGNDPKFGPESALDSRSDTAWATDDGVTQAALDVDLGQPTTFNVARIDEMIRLGQRVKAYRIEAKFGTTWRTLSEGTTIGYRKLDRFPPVTTSRVRLTILDARASPVISTFGLYDDTVSPPSAFDPANANAEPPRHA